MPMEAHLLAKNNFGMPKVLTDSDAEYTNIIYLMLLVPGTFQSHPEMGINIRQYRFSNDADLIDTIRANVRQQIDKYLPTLIASEITITSIKNNVLGIVINTDNGAYVLAYNMNDDTIDAGATYVLDQL